MKRSFIVIPFLALSFVSVSLVGNDKPIKVSALEPTKVINMEASSFVVEGLYSDPAEAGTFAASDVTFWDEHYSFNALGTFFRGETNEAWKGALKIKPWTQYTQYVYFQWGGAKNFDVDGDVSLVFHYGDYSSTMLNNTFSENPMLLRYFKIPDDEFNNLDKVNGFEMYIELVDQRNGSNGAYSFHNFGYLHVNQSKQDVIEAMRYYINHMDISDTREWKVNNNKAIYGHYLANEGLKSLLLEPVNDISDGFESNESFMKNWYLDINYDNFKETNRHVDDVIGTDDYRLGDSKMPFNKTGTGFFRGWYEESLHKGYVASDLPRYRFVSRPFELKGTGLVSIKMAGRSASLHVIDTETQTDLAWADLKTFNGEGNESDQNVQALTGFNTVTMVRHFINLEEFVGRTIQLAIADVHEENWAASYFDELVTYYEEYPNFGLDVVTQTNETATSYKVYFDKYIASTHIDTDDKYGLKYAATKEEVNRVDSTTMFEAYKFLETYYSTVRNVDNNFALSGLSAEAKTNIFNGYASLNTAAKKLVKNAKDYEYASNYGNEWYLHEPVILNKTVELSITALKTEYHKCFVSFDANGGTGVMADVAASTTSDYTLPECTFTAPDRKEFDCWIVNEQEKAAGASVSLSDDITIKAKWKDIIYYNITFNANGGTGEMNSIRIKAGEEVTLPRCTFTAPTDKEFDCWLVGEERKQAGDRITVNANVEVKAVWKAIIYYVVDFNANGGTGEMNPVRVREGQTYTLPACTFTAPADKKFDCWLVGETRKQPGDVITITANITIKASWINIVYYTVSFNANGGTGEISSITVKEGEQATLPECTFTAPADKEFKCWIVGNSKKQPGDKIDVTGDIEVFASWKTKEVEPVINTYTISFNANGGTGTMNSITMNENEEYTLPACTFTAPSGKEFDCWIVNGQEMRPGEKITIKGNVEIT